MRWPWVSAERLADAQDTIRRLRAKADELVALVGYERNQHSAQLTAERDRYAALVAHVVELKKLDYGPPVVVPQPPPQKPLTPIPSPVTANIARVSDPDTRERRQIEGRVRDLLASGVPPEEVAQMVLDGEPVPVEL